MLIDGKTAEKAEGRIAMSLDGCAVNDGFAGYGGGATMPTEGGATSTTLTAGSYGGYSNRELGVTVTAKQTILLISLESLAGYIAGNCYHLFHKKGDHSTVDSRKIVGESDGWTKLVAPNPKHDRARRGSWVARAASIWYRIGQL
jgi:hypothetical protein|eukprot:7391821-Prymnesium_polylepis.1